MHPHTCRSFCFLAPLAPAAVLIGALMAAMSAQAAPTTTRYVAPAGTDSGDCSSSGAPCRTIAYAAGQAAAGDTISIAAGIYYENVTSAKGLTFVGAGQDSTIVDGSGTGRVFEVTALQSNFADLTIRNGSALTSATTDGGGIRAMVSLTLTNVAVISNTATQGGGVYAYRRTIITGCNFLGNVASNGGGGGGLYAYAGAYITNSFFITNVSGIPGGGVHLSGAASSITNTQFISNSTYGSTTYGAGVNATATAPLSVFNSQFFSNTSIKGAGIAAQGPVTVADSIFSGNVATSTSNSDGGGGLYTYKSAVINNTQFLTNISFGSGGGLFSRDVVTITGSLFSGNRISATNGYGGGMYLYPSVTAAAISGTQFISNTALYLGGGLGFSLTTGRVVLTNTQFVGNRAAASDGLGGAIYAGSATAADGITATNNTAGASGGAIYANSWLTLTNSYIYSNTTANGSGGGLFGSNTNAQLVFTDVQFLSNSAGDAASSAGGGLYAAGPLQLSGIVFQDNRCPSGYPSCQSSAGLYAYNAVTIDAALPYTISDDLDLRRNLAIYGDLSLTGGTVTFGTSGSTTSHSMQGTGRTAYKNLAVQLGSYLNVGSSVITVTGVVTNQGVVERVAPAQTIAVGPAYTFDDGVGYGTAVVQQTGGTAMADTSLRTRANLTTTAFTCGPTLLSQPVQRAWTITPTNTANVTVDLTLSYFDGAANSEANGNLAAGLRFYSCNGLAWQPLDGTYTSGTAGNYKWVKLGGYTGNAFGEFALAPRLVSSNANLANLTLSAGALSPNFDPLTINYTANAPNPVYTVMLTPTVQAADATVAVQGRPVVSGTASAPITVVVGSNVITTLVTAPDGISTKTYTVTVTRAPTTGPWYVNPLGNDVYTCAAPDTGHACRTIGGAISLATAGDTINIASGTYTEHLAVNKALTFVGAGADGTFVDGGGNGRVFAIDDSSVVLTDLAVQHGSAASGAGINANVNASLTLTRVTVADNTATSGNGGGIAAAGPMLNIAESTIFSNTASGSGGGIAASATLTATIYNTTFYANSSTLYGGALFNYDASPQLSNVSFSANQSDAGGAVANLSDAAGITPRFANAILWGDSANAGGEIFNMSVNAHNVAPAVDKSIVQGGCPAQASCTDVTSSDPRYGTFGNYGGNTYILPLLPGSAAINAGGSGVCNSLPVDGQDQRGVTRPQLAACDIGAFESQGFTLAVAGGDNQQAAVNGAFTAPLSITVSSGRWSDIPEPVDGGIVTYTAPASGASITAVPAAVIITNSAAELAVTANGLMGSYLVTATAPGENAISFHLTNTRYASSTALDIAPNPALVDDNVTFTVGVSTASVLTNVLLAKPTGSVTVTAPGNAIKLVGTLVDGAATFNKDGLPAGSYDVTAEYGGDATFAGSTSGAHSLVVNKYGAAAALTSSSNPVFVGDTLNFTVSVSEAALNGFKAGGLPIYPTGTVTVTDVSGLIQLTGQLNNGLLAAAAPWLPAGPYTVTAQYGGNQRYLPGTSNALVQVVEPLPTAVNDAGGTLQATPVTIKVLANDLDPVGRGLTVSALTVQPIHGTAEVSADGLAVHYLPDAEFVGLDSFTYVVEDGNGSTDDALVTVVVTAKSTAGEAPQIAPVDPAVDSSIQYTSPGVGIDVEMPAGFFTATVGPKDIFFLAYTPVVTPTEKTQNGPDGLKFGNFEFDLTTFLNNEPQHGVQYAVPVTITIAYDPALLGGQREDTLKVYHWAGTAWSMDGITVVARDVVNHAITIAISHMSDFAFFAATPTGENPAPEPELNLRLFLPGVMRESNLGDAAAPPQPEAWTNHTYLPAVQR